MGLLVDLATGGKSLSESVKTVEIRTSMHPVSDGTATPAQYPKSTSRTERRRHQVLVMLEETPTARIAVVTDDRAERDTVIVTIAIRGKGTCDVRIPRHKYDGPRLLDLIQKHATTVH